MPIDAERFAYWWALWCEKWNRTPKPTPAFTLEFHRAVNHLAPDAWEAAAAALFAGPGYFPSPADVLEKVAPADVALAGLKLKAAQAFDAVLGLAGYGPHGAIWRRDAIETRLGPLALRAFDLAGGAAKFRHLTEADEHWTRRAFCDAYVEQGKALERQTAAQDRLTAVATGRRPALGGGAVRSPRLEHIATVLPLLPRGTTPPPNGTTDEGNGTDG